MHAEALAWVADCVPACGDPASVLDLGGRDINGTPRPLFPGTDYVTLDIRPGADITADAATWTPDREYDAVVCTEVFEHTEVWRDICATAFAACRPGGVFVVTCAGPGRAPHSGVDGGEVRDGEWYGNVGTAELEQALLAAGWVDVVVDQAGPDTRALARKAAA